MSDTFDKIEISVPIIINTVTIENSTGDDTVQHDVQYFNVYLEDCPPYIPSPVRQDTYIRSHPIRRSTVENVTWPIHSLNVHGVMQGAIIAIVSLDWKILMVRNGALWGLPKGARNYRTMMDLKAKTELHYYKTKEVYVHENADFRLADAETAVENIYRETLEETGIKIDISKLETYGIADATYCAYDRFYYNFPYEARYHRDMLDQNPADHENDEIAWFPLLEVAEMMVAHTGTNRIFNHVTVQYLRDFLNDMGPDEHTVVSTDTNTVGVGVVPCTDTSTSTGMVPGVTSVVS